MIKLRDFGSIISQVTLYVFSADAVTSMLVLIFSLARQLLLQCDRFHRHSNFSVGPP